MLSTLWMMIQISGKGISLALKSYLIPIHKVQSFLKSNIWPKPNMQNGAYIKPLNLEL